MTADGVRHLIAEAVAEWSEGEAALWERITALESRDDAGGMTMTERISSLGDRVAQRLERLEHQAESLQVQLTAVVDRLNQHRERAERQDRQLDVLAAEITRLQQQGGGDAERTLRIVEQALGLAERRVSA